MTKVNDKTYVNKENVVIAQEVNGEYLLTLASGITIAVSKEVYEEVVEQEV